MSRPLRWIEMSSARILIAVLLATAACRPVVSVGDGLEHDTGPTTDAAPPGDLGYADDAAPNIDAGPGDSESARDADISSPSDTGSGDTGSDDTGSDDTGPADEDGSAPATDALPASDAGPRADATIPDAAPPATTGPDLTLALYQYVPIVALPGGELSMEILVQNIGDLDSPTSQVTLAICVTSCAVNSIQLLTTDSGPLSAGESRLVPLTIPLPSSLATGPYQMFGVIDPASLVLETQETNNISNLLSFLVADAALAPQRIDFGSVRAACPASGQTLLTNIGPPLTVFSISLGAGTSTSFSLAPTTLPLTVATGATLALDVILTPAALGAHTGTVELFHGRSAAPLEVYISGFGVPNTFHLDTATGDGTTQSFTLSGLPETATLAVTIDGVIVPGSDWVYDAPTNTVVFDLSAVPAAGTAVLISYSTEC